MGRQKKRKIKGSKAKSDASQPPKNPKSNLRWDKQLTEALDILDSWAAVEDSELTTVLTQLASILQMRAESDAASSSALPADRIATALELACSHRAHGARKPFMHHRGRRQPWRSGWCGAAWSGLWCAKARRLRRTSAQHVGMCHRLPLQ